MKKRICFLGVSLVYFIFILNAQPPAPPTLPGTPFPAMPSGMPTVPTIDAPPMPGITPTTMPTPAMPEITPDVSSTISTPVIAPGIPPEEAAPPIPEAAPPMVGPETMQLPEDQVGTQGNWVKKREWLKEAVRLNDEIQKLVVNIQKSKKVYTDKFNIIDNELDIFYKTQGFEQGQIQELFNSIDKYLDKKKKQEIEKAKLETEQKGITGEYEIKLDIIEKEIDTHQTELEQLKLDMKSLQDLDKSVKDRLERVDEQITIALNESTNAQKLIDDTWSVIDDKKARKNYYEIKNISERIKTLQEYLQDDLLNDFDKVLSTIRTQILRIKVEINNIEEKEFIIRNRTQRIKQIKLEELEKERIKEIKIPEKEIAVIPTTWFTRFYNFIVDKVAKTYIFFKNLFGIKMSEAPVEKKVPLQEPILPEAAAPAMPT